MKGKRSFQIAFAVALLILVLPACRSGNEATGITPTLQEAEAPSEDEAGEGQNQNDDGLSIPLSESFHIETDSFEFEGQERTFMVFIPDNYTEGENYPLVIYLHSYGWNPQLGMDYTQLNQVGNAYNFLIAYPSGRSNWNSGIEDNSSWPTPDVDDVGFINALIDMLSKSYSIDLERIYATGYSNGGFMAYKLACQLGHRIAAIATVGGIISTTTLEECNPSRAIPVLHIHGTKDPWVPLDGLSGWHSVEETISYWTNINNCENAETTSLPDTDPRDESTVERISYTDCTNNSNVIYYEVINGGHTWPGAGPTGYSAGNTNQDFNAGVEIWNFFKDYQLKSTSVEN